MSEKLELIKKLRSEGASIRMIDDVAAFLGSYEGPVFVATVEFIIKVKNMIQSVTVQVEQEIEVETENIDFEAAKSAVNSDEELPEDERFKMLEAISAIQLQHLEFKEIETPEAVIGDDQKDKKKSSTKRNDKGFKNSLLDKINRVREALRNRQRQLQNQTQQIDDLERTAQKNAAARTNQLSANKAQSHAGMRLLKLDFLKSLKTQKDPTMLGQNKFKEYKQSKQFVSKQQIKADQASEKIKKTSEELNVSKLIDNLVKGPKEQKVEVTEDKTIKTEKGKFEARVESASLPKADAEKVAKQTAKEAIEALQKSGVKPSVPDAAMKKEMEAQLAQSQTQLAAQQKQR